MMINRYRDSLANSNVRNAYIGFSNIGGKTHISASNAGIAQSDYTLKLLQEVRRTDYYVCLSEESNDFTSTSVKPIRIRNGLFYNFIDSVRFIFILLSSGPYSKIVIYHSFLFWQLVILLRIFRLSYVLQVNEIFSRSGTHKSRLHKIIEKIIFNCASSYIVSTESIIPFLKNKPGQRIDIIAVVPGPIIQRAKSCNSLIDPNFGKHNSTRIVYAGVVDQKKNGGAFVAVDLAQKLNSTIFEIDIFGFGTQEDVSELLEKVKYNNSISLTRVRFLGNLSPSKLVDAISQYDVGLATQYIGTSFSESSFPSKILTYLSAGLNVFCATSIAVESWKPKDILFVYKDENLSDLVFALKNLKLKSKNQIIEALQIISEEILDNFKAKLK